MASVLRQLQAEWNAMVPIAQARGIRRVKILGGGDVSRAPLETIAYRRAKVEWLRSLLGATALSPSAVNQAPTLASLAGIDVLRFGVELECIMPIGWDRVRLAREVSAAGVPCRDELYGHGTPTVWKIITDASVGYTRGAEVVSPPIRGEDGFRQLRIVCEVLTRIGCKITSKCGFHVHVGCRDAQAEFFKNLVVLYSSAERAIDQFMPDSRKGSNNRFCQPVKAHNRHALRNARTIPDVVRAVGQVPGPGRNDSRYCKLNLQAFFAYGTVEFRHHGGTVDPVKAQNWVRLCLRMVLAARAGEHEVTTVDELMAAVGADGAEREYFRSRVAFFNRGREALAAQVTAAHNRIARVDVTPPPAEPTNPFDVYADRALEHARGPVRRQDPSPFGTRRWETAMDDRTRHLDANADDQ